MWSVNRPSINFLEVLEDVGSGAFVPDGIRHAGIHQELDTREEASLSIDG